MWQKKSIENAVIDTEKNEIIVNDSKIIPLYSPEGFRIVSQVWLKVGWDQKHLYSFTWLGRPIIQIPDDAFRIQEVIYTLKPDVIIETGIAHGGSLIFYASICKCIGKGKVIGVDLEIRPHNRKAIEEHELFDLITIIEGNSIEENTVKQVRSLMCKSENTLVVLDSCHDYDHVMKELEIYSQFVSSGSYIVVTDGSQKYLSETPRAQREYKECSTWNSNNPQRAAEDFVKNNSDFEIVEPGFSFNEGNIDFRVTHWPSAFVQRVN